MHTAMDAFWRRSCEETIRLRGSVLLQGRQRRDCPPPGAAAPQCSNLLLCMCSRRHCLAVLPGSSRLTIFKLSQSTSDTLRATHLPCWKC